MRILALQLKRIGDLALTTPALRALKASAPDARVTLVVRGAAAGLLPALTPWVDEGLVWGAGRNGAILRRLARGGFDWCVDFTGRDRSAFLTLVSHAPRRLVARSALRGSAWRRLCYNRFAETPVRGPHTIDFYLGHASVMPGARGLAPEAHEGPVLDLPQVAVQAGRAALEGVGIGVGEPFIAVHPGTARAEKYWLPERWAEVIAFCQESLGIRCVLTGGRGDADEEAHLARIRACLPRPCADLAGKLDLLALTAVFAQAQAVAGVDSGPMHLAAAVRRPQLVLFGPTNPRHWRPRHAGCLVLRAGHGDEPLREFPERTPGAPMDAISTRAVIECITQLARGA